MTSDARPAVPDRPVAREDVVFRALAREWVLYDPRTRQLHVLNVTAALVWSLCDGGHGVGDMARAVADCLAGAPAAEALDRDVRDALRVFAREGLLA